MAALHHEALGSALAVRLRWEAVTTIVNAAGEFFAESLAPFELTHRAFREANAALRHLNEALEEQAGRIAHALHDEAGQLLASVHLAIDEVAREAPPGTQERLRTIRGLLDEIEAQLRRFSHELRPTILDDLGLRPALEFLARGVSARAGFHVTVEGSSEGRLPLAIETVLYRVVQEGLTNAAKHARATCVRVQLQREAGVMRCSIRDDGIGLGAAAVLARAEGRGLGLVGIRERVGPLGGKLEIASAPGHGTTLSVEIPLDS
jgi:signal transduction histidine kinase